jgi:hypothetical protein
MRFEIIDRSTLIRMPSPSSSCNRGPHIQFLTCPSNSTSARPPTPNHSRLHSKYSQSSIHQPEAEVPRARSEKQLSAQIPWWEDSIAAGCCGDHIASAAAMTTTVIRCGAGKMDCRRARAHHNWSAGECIRCEQIQRNRSRRDRQGSSLTWC